MERSWRSDGVNTADGRRCGTQGIAVTARGYVNDAARRLVQNEANPRSCHHLYIPKSCSFLAEPLNDYRATLPF
jgi:hypothetical protein